MGGAIRGFRDLVVWQHAMDLVERVYRMTRTFPPEVRYGLTSQIRRAAVSIPSNIAEGYSHSSTAEYRNFLSIARGSAAELETQALIAVRLGYVTVHQASAVLSLVAEISRMLAAIRTRLDPRQ